LISESLEYEKYDREVAKYLSGNFYNFFPALQSWRPVLQLFVSL